MKKIRIILVEDHQLVREAWKASLLKDEKYEIVGEAENVKTAVELIKTISHDVIILDINLKNESGVDVVHQTKGFVENPKFIVVSMMSEYAFIKNMMQLGVKGYVTKNSSIIEMIQAIEKVHQGETFLCHEINEIILSKSFLKENEENLSNKELLVFKEICSGISTKDMSEKLGVSVKTIEGHKTKIYKKLKTSNLVELLKYAKEKGIIS